MSPTDVRVCGAPFVLAILSRRAYVVKVIRRRGSPFARLTPRRAPAGALLTVLMSAAFALPCPATQDSLYREARPAMGTIVQILLHAPTPERAAELLEAAFAEIDYADATLSNYQKGSEVSRINANAAHEAVTVDPEVFALLARAVEYSRRTGGAFDVTVGPLVKAWGFFRGTGRYPAEDLLAQARIESGWTLLALDSAARTVRFRRRGMEIDLGAIGKGWALDRAATVLRRSGVEAALLDAGQSSYVAIGAPPGMDGWPVHVIDPFETTRVLSTVLLRDWSLATSGSAGQSFESGGQRYSHIIDPRSGTPVTGMVQVTVTAESATDSDALSTALFVLGPDSASTLLTAMPEVGALVVQEIRAAPRVRQLHWRERRGIGATTGVVRREES